LRAAGIARGGLLAAALLLPAGHVAAQAPDLFGRPIASVAYTANGPVNPTEVAELIALEAGEILTDAATGTTIRNLFATEQFSDVLIEAEPQPDGSVAVTVHLFRSFRVNPLRFDDGVSLSREEMRRSVPFSEGSVFRADALEEGAAALKRRAASEGFIQAEVFPEVEFDWETFEAHVIYRIESGRPARVSRVLFDGETAPFRAEELLEKARLDPGDRYRETRARRDAERMTELLHRRGHLEGLIELIAAQPTEPDGVMPVYRITVGPEVVFEAKGVSPRKVRRELHGLIEGQRFDEDIVLQYVEEKKLELQAKGYYRAQVDYDLQRAPEKTTVTITIDEDGKFAVEEIRITGNESVPEKELRRLMVTQKKGLPYLRPGRLVDEILREDRSAILGYYQTRGWVNAKVAEPSVVAGSSPDRLIVGITIEEGPRALVSARRLEGADHADPKELDGLFLVVPGEPFNPNEVRQDVSRLQTHYRDRGWREAAVGADWTLSADGTSADVVYKVEEGLQSFFGKTIVRGNNATRTNRITRLVTWDEGDPLSESALLHTQRNLSRTGVFRRVLIEPQQAEVDTRVRNIEIEVEEGRSRSLLYGIGYQYAPDARENQHDPYLTLGYSHNNLFGTMRSLGAEIQAATSGRGRFQITYREPFLFGEDVTLVGLLFASREPIQEVEIERLGFVMEASRLFGRNLRTALRYEYQRIEPTNPEDLSDIEREFRRFDRPIEQATIGPNAFYDRRDDVIDPHEGYYLTAAAKYAFPMLSAEARYTKFSWQGAYFQPLGRSVFAVSARAGGIFPYGLRERAVPIAERFFAGGRSTNRAFDTDLQGVPGLPGRLDSLAEATVDYDTRVTATDDGGPGSCADSGGFIRDNPDFVNFDCDFGPRIVGGNGFVALNAELRFPIAGPIGGTLFWDASQIWPDFSDIRFSLEGDEGLRQGYGVGLRYMSPIGPIRAEYAWPLRPRTIRFDVTETVRDEDDNVFTVIRGSGETRESGRFLISIGYPF
jgi:outer membrane protein insertion porin family